MIKLLATSLMGFVCYWLSGYADFKDGNAACVLCVFFCIVFIALITLIMVSAWGDYTDQIEDIERIMERVKRKDIYTKQRDELAEVFKQHLAQQYPDYEKDIFSKLLPENITAVATIFPEIKSSETIMDYCNKINSLTSGVYKEDIAIAGHERKIRVRKRDLTGWWFLMPIK